jgi:hypothetical protein
MTEPPETTEGNQIIYGAAICSQNPLAHVSVADMVSPPYTSNATQATVIENS